MGWSIVFNNNFIDFRNIHFGEDKDLTFEKVFFSGNLNYLTEDSGLIIRQLNENFFIRTLDKKMFQFVLKVEFNSNFCAREHVFQSMLFQH